MVYFALFSALVIIYPPNSAHKSQHQPTDTPLQIQHLPAVQVPSRFIEFPHLFAAFQFSNISNTISNAISNNNMARKRHAAIRADAHKRKKANDGRHTRSNPAPNISDRDSAENSQSMPQPKQRPAPSQVDGPDQPVTDVPPTDKTTDQPSDKADDNAIIVFQCVNCRVVVGDTTTAYVADFEANLISLTAARSVIVQDDMHLSKSGFDVGCSFKSIHCQNCKHILGRVYFSTTPQLDSLRSTYALHSSSLESYQLGTCQALTGQQAPPSAAGIALAANLKSLGEPTLRAFGKMDENIRKLTKRMDRVNDFIRDRFPKYDQYDVTVKEIQSTLDSVRNLFLAWDDRFQRLQDCERQIGLLTAEYRNNRDLQLVPASRRAEAGEQSPDVHVVEPARTPLRSLPPIPEPPASSLAATARKKR